MVPKPGIEPVLSFENRYFSVNFERNKTQIKMTNEPTLDLFVDTSYTPDYYWIDVTLSEESTYEIVSHGTVPTTVNTKGELHVDVRVQNENGGANSITIQLGQPNLHPQTGEVHIHLKTDLQTSVGGGTVSTQNAQESTR